MREKQGILTNLKKKKKNKQTKIWAHDDNEGHMEGYCKPFKGKTSSNFNAYLKRSHDGYARAVVSELVYVATIKDKFDCTYDIIVIQPAKLGWVIASGPLNIYCVNNSDVSLWRNPPPPNPGKKRWK